MPKPETPVTFDELSDYGAHMTLQEFLDDVRSNSIIDYDGSGRLATATQESSVEVYPSTIHQILYRHPEYLEWATHVVWFNK